MYNFSGFEWLLMDLASRFGKDKATYTDRINWAVEILDLFKVDTLEHLKTNLEPWIADADDKPHFVGAAIAIWDTMQGNTSNWMVSQDSASSGAQLGSCLTKCVVGMRNTGVLGTEVPDLYTTVNVGMAESGSDLPRKVLKKGMIPHMYKSVAAPKRIFKEDYPVFCKAYATAVPRAHILSDLLADSWNSNATEHVIRAPDNFEAVLPVLVKDSKKLPFLKHTYTYTYTKSGTKIKGKAQGTKSLSANTHHVYDAYVLRELNRRCNYDVCQITEAIQALQSPQLGKVDRYKAIYLNELEKLSIRFNQVSVVAVEYIDVNTAACISKEYANRLIEVLEQMLVSKPFEIKNVHDDFACLPNYVTHMKYMYNVLLRETYLGKWVYAVLESLTGKVFPVSAIDPVIADQILDAPYSVS